MYSSNKGVLISFTIAIFLKCFEAVCIITYRTVKDFDTYACQATEPLGSCNWNWGGDCYGNYDYMLKQLDQDKCSSLNINKEGALTATFITGSSESTVKARCIDIGGAYEVSSRH
ncbi:unnamed protein product [Cunninghamella echinulata]